MARSPREPLQSWKRQQRVKPTQDRPCLRCDTLFPSTGPENRICPHCHHLADAAASLEETRAVHLKTHHGSWPVG